MLDACRRSQMAMFAPSLFPAIVRAAGALLVFVAALAGGEGARAQGPILADAGSLDAFSGCRAPWSGLDTDLEVVGGPFSTMGPKGGPFPPVDVGLRNGGNKDLFWRFVDEYQDRIDMWSAEPSEGALRPGAEATVRVSMTRAGESVQTAGEYCALMHFATGFPPGRKYVEIHVEVTDDAGVGGSSGDDDDNDDGDGGSGGGDDTDDDTDDTGGGDTGGGGGSDDSGGGDAGGGGGGPFPPGVAAGLDDVTLVLGQPPREVDVSDAFAGTRLTHTAETSDDSVAAVGVAGTVVTVTPVAVGAASVTVTAENAAGRVRQAFDVTVQDAPPAAAGRLDDVTLTVGHPPYEVDASDAFGGTNLTYLAESSNPAVAGVVVAGTVVTVSARTSGTVSVTVTAENSAGRASQSFEVTVRDVPPAASGHLDDVTLTVGHPPHEVDLSDAFDGTNLTYLAESSNPAVVAVAAAGTVVTVAPAVEGAATVTVTARNSAGTALLQFVVTVTTDAAELSILEDTLAAMGRQALAGVTGAIERRFAAARSRTPAAAARSAALSMGGLFLLRDSRVRGPHETGPMSTSGSRVGTQRALVGGPTAIARPLSPATDHGDESSLLDRLLWDNDFVLPLSGAGGDGTNGAAPAPRWALWGASDLQAFRGAPEAGSYDGAVKSVYLGIDARASEHWTAGVAVSLSRGGADYRFAGDRARGAGRLDTSLTSLLPYVRWVSDTGDEVWGTFGAGVGDARLARAGTTASLAAAGHGLLLGAAGWRRALGAGSGLRFSTLGNVGVARLTAAGEAGPLAGLAASVQRVRAGVEVEHAGSVVRPFVQASGIADAGAGQTGAGLEVLGGARYAARSGLAIEAGARALALHSAGGYREYGAFATARYAPSPDGRGLSLALSPRWGAGAEGSGSGALWRGQELRPGLYGPSAHDRSALDGEVAYGIASGAQGLTAFGRFDLAAGRGGRAGVRLNVIDRTVGSLDVEVSAAGRRYPGYATDRRIDAAVRLSF